MLAYIMGPGGLCRLLSLHCGDWGEAELHWPGESGLGVMKLVLDCSAPDWGGVGMKAYEPIWPPAIMPGCPPMFWDSGKSKDCILWCEAPRMAAK